MSAAMSTRRRLLAGHAGEDEDAVRAEDREHVEGHRRDPRGLVHDVDGTAGALEQPGDVDSADET